MLALRGLVFIISLVIIWQLTVWGLHLPVYILPGPAIVAAAWWHNLPLIMAQTCITFSEALLGLLVGSLLGIVSALAMSLFRPIHFWLLPLLVISQAIPTFAIAPLLVIWFGYGLTSKIVTTVLMLYFPVTSAFFDGLRHTNTDWLDMATMMKGSRWRILWHIRVPAALPSLATGLRVATAFAPMGAIVGEWVGSSRGLGFLMLNANARMQIDVMFACLFTLVFFTLALYFAVDKLLHVAIPWQAGDAH